jgi:hypothetical protein
MAMKTTNIAVVEIAYDISTKKEESNCEWRKFN